MNKSVRSVLLIGGMLAAAIMFMFLGNRQFHNQAFNGIVDSTYRSEKNDAFFIAIDGFGREFDVRPLSKAPPIEKIVAKGDSLFKKQNTDTVVLVHQKQVFKYTLNRGVSLFAN